MKPCISQATTLSTSFADDVNGYADAGVRAMEVWLTKLEQHLEKHSPADTRKLLEDRQMTLAAAAYQGGLLLSEGAAKKAHFDHFRRRLDLCRFFGIPTLILAPDFAERAEPAALETVVARLATAAQWAAAANIRLALEFRASDRLIASLPTALAVVAGCGEPNIGVCLDVFHFWTGPSKFEDLAALTPQHLAHVQICDVGAMPRELATDADRILPGDGDFPLEGFIKAVRALGYDGWLSLELLNKTLWQMKTSQVAEIGLAAMNRLVESGSGAV